MTQDGLRELEHLVLLAIARLDSPAHGVPIVKELQQVVDRSISRASIYVVLRRLELKGYVTSTLGDPTPQRGGRAKRLYALTPVAVRALRSAQQNFVRLWAGSRVLACLIALGLAAGAPAIAQDRPQPNLTGTWINLSDPNATDVKTASNLPNALLTITHTGATFNLTRSWSNEAIKESHVCDGRENSNGYSIVVERTRCRWEPERGGTLVIEGSIGRDDGTITGSVRNRYWLDAQGVMHVERTRTVFSVDPANTGRAQTQQYRRVPPEASISW